MNADNQSTESVRNRYEADIMAVDGVVSVGIGLNEAGAPCIIIGTSVPPEDVREKLPQEIFEVGVEIRNIGEIKAQDR